MLSKHFNQISYCLLHQIIIFKTILVFDRDMEFVIKPVIQSELLKATVSTKKDISIGMCVCVYVVYILFV